MNEVAPREAALGRPGGRHREDQEGFALIVAIATLVVGSILVSLFTVTTSREARATADGFAATQAFYVAQAGVDLALRSENPATTIFAGGSVTTTIVDSTIVATGTFHDSARVIQVEIPSTDEGDLLLHWKFDEMTGAIASDSSGNSNDGAFSGTPVWDTGRIGGGLRFNGNDRVTDDDAELYLSGLEGVTVAMWVKADSVPKDRGLFDTKTSANSRDDHLSARYDHKGWGGGGIGLIKSAVDASGGDTQIEGASNTQTTEWQHVTIVWSSGDPLLQYINGAVDTTVYTHGIVAGTLTGIDTFMVGRGVKNKTWHGLIDDVRVYGRALSPAEVFSISQP